MLKSGNKMLKHINMIINSYDHGDVLIAENIIIIIILLG